MHYFEDIEDLLMRGSQMGDFGVEVEDWWGFDVFEEGKEEFLELGLVGVGFYEFTELEDCAFGKDWFWVQMEDLEVEVLNGNVLVDQNLTR